MKILALFLLLATQVADASTKTIERQAIADLFETAELLATSDLSCNESLDCDALALGSRACGGVNSYVITSRLNPNYEMASMVALESQKREAEYNQKYRVVSICSIIMPPAASCVQNICQ